MSDFEAFDILQEEVARLRRSGYDNKRIRDTLLANRWPPDIIDEVLS